MLPGFIQFACYYIILGVGIRFLCLKFPDSAFTQPLLFLH